MTADIREIKGLLKQIEEKLEQLDKKVTSLTEHPAVYQIKIQQIDMHQPVLNELTFRLDNLDIKELSGALNIGNNFGIGKKMHLHEKNAKIASKKSKQAEKTIEVDDDSLITIKVNGKYLSFLVDDAKVGGE